MGARCIVICWSSTCWTKQYWSARWRGSHIIFLSVLIRYYISHHMSIVHWTTSATPICFCQRQQGQSFPQHQRDFSTVLRHCLPFQGFTYLLIPILAKTSYIRGPVQSKMFVFYILSGQFITYTTQFTDGLIHVTVVCYVNQVDRHRGIQLLFD